MIAALQEWINRVHRTDIPVFQATVRSIAKVTAKQDASVSELATAILKDSCLTSKILRFANSPYFNPSGTPTNTVSRAVVLMGFEVVKELSMSLAIIESLLDKKKRAVVNELMAKAFHAATQARNMARVKGDSGLEEVFVASLLYNIGEMTFWCIAEDELVEELELLIEEESYTPEKAQKEVLGFKLKELTIGLVEKWNLNDILASALKDDGSNSLLVKYTKMGRQVAEAITDDWDSKDAKKTYQAVSDHLGITPRKAKKMVRENARAAAEVALNYGAFDVARLIPGFEDLEVVEESRPQSPETVPEYPDPDPLLQLKILRDLSSLLKSNPDLNIIIEVLLEGMHRGIGLDRSAFALYVPIKSQVRAKFVVGLNAEALMNNFSFSVGDVTSNPFSEVLLEKRKGIWMTDNSCKDYSKTMVRQIKNALGTANFFISPIIVNQRPIGLFYADRQPSKRQLDEASYESFEHFVHQATLAIDFLSRNNR